MTADMPISEIAKDAARGLKVAVFCDDMRQLDEHRRALANRLRVMNVGAVRSSRSRRRVTVRGNSVEFLLANGIDGRGLSADVVYLSESARTQYEFAALMGGEVR